MIGNNGTLFHPTPPRRHRKNVLESKHGIILSILLRLRESVPYSLEIVSAEREIRISDDLYVSDTLCAI